MTASALCDPCGLYWLLRYLHDFAITKQHFCDASVSSGQHSLCFLAVVNILHVHKYRLWCAKLQAQNDDFLCHPLKC